MCYQVTEVNDCYEKTTMHAHSYRLRHDDYNQLSLERRCQ